MKAEVLRFLFATEGQELDARDMARRAGLAGATIGKSWPDLLALA